MLAPTLISIALALAAEAQFHRQYIRQDANSACLASAGVQSSFAASPDYDEARHTYNSQFDFKPIVVVRPETREQIGAALKCAGAAGLPVAARSGGHSYWGGGVGGQDGSVVIDLAAFNGVHVDQATGIAKVGPGELLGGMYAQLFEQGGRAVSAGTCPSVGVGGHAAHGGLGFSTREHGLLLDAIVKVDGVLANGTLFTASANENAELFYGVRGAASSLAVIDAFYFQTFAARPENIAYGYGASTDPYTAVQAIQAVQTWAQSDAADPRIGMNVETFLGAAEKGQIRIQIVGIAHMPSAEFNASIAKLVETLPESMREPNHRYGLNWTEALLVNTGGLALASVPQPARANYASTFVSGPLTEHTLVDLWYYLAYDGMGLNGADGNPFAFLQMHLVANSAYSAVPEDATAFPRRNAMWNAQAFTTMAPESGLPLPERAIQTMDMVFKKVLYNEPWSSDIGSYLNYGTATIDDHELRYYGSHYNRLLKLKRSVDPASLFSSPLAVGPV